MRKLTLTNIFHSLRRLWKTTPCAVEQEFAPQNYFFPTKQPQRKICSGARLEKPWYLDSSTEEENARAMRAFQVFSIKKLYKLFQSVLTITSWTGASNYTQFQNRVQEVSQKYSNFWDLLGLPLAWQSWGNYWVMVLCRFPPIFLVATNQWMWTILSPISTTDSLSMEEP